MKYVLLVIAISFNAIAVYIAIALIASQSYLAASLIILSAAYLFATCVVIIIDISSSNGRRR